MTRTSKGTNVRITIARAALRVLAAAAPGLAAEAASRLFLRVPRTPRARGTAAAFLAGGEPLALEADGVPLAAWTWGRGPAVLLVHGWAGRGAQMRAFVPALVSAGFRAVVFDAPAHGASPGRSASIPAFSRAIDAALRATGARAAIAHSMGGAATLVALASGTPLERAVLLGSPASASRIWAGWRRALGLPDSVAEETLRRLEARVGTTFASLDAVRVGPRVTAPVLVLHDRDDAEIPWSSACEIAAAVPGARLVGTRGLGHRGVLRDPGVVAGALAFLAEGLDPALCAGCRRALGFAGDAKLCGTCLVGRELFETDGRFAA